MKTQLSKPARDRARYTDEYKEQALQLAGQWSQCRQGCGGAGDPAPAALPLGTCRAPAGQHFDAWTEAPPQR